MLTLTSGPPVSASAVFLFTVGVIFLPQHCLPLLIARHSAWRNHSWLLFSVLGKYNKRITSIQSEIEMGWGWTAILVWVNAPVVHHILEHGSWRLLTESLTGLGLLGPEGLTDSAFPFSDLSIGPTPRTFKIRQHLEKEMAVCYPRPSPKRFCLLVPQGQGISFYLWGSLPSSAQSFPFMSLQASCLGLL